MELLMGYRARALSFLAGVGMIVFSVLTIRHFFQANYPESIYAGSFCDINSFFNCNSSAYSKLAAIGGVPLGYFGLFVGALVCIGAVFASPEFERTNRIIAFVNAFGVLSLFTYSVAITHSLCLLCSGYYVFSLISAAVFWKASEQWGLPSLKHAATFVLIMSVGAYGMREYHTTKKQAQSGGVAAHVVEQYFALPQVKLPSVISPYWTAKATEKFEDAPIQVVEYADFRCPDCQYLHAQLQKLEQEFKGKVNIAFQFFPLEAKCNRVVDKDKHPGACDLAYIAAYNPAKFVAIHDEIFANFDKSKSPEWRADFAKRIGAEAALTDTATQQKVQQIVQTGAEYAPTHEKYSAGVRSTPTMIINGRMVIGTFPYEQLRAIFQALATKNGKPGAFMEHWQE